MKLPNHVVALTPALMLSACATMGTADSGSKAALTGQEWIVEDIGGRGVIDNSHATLRFGEDGRLSGNASCNRLIGTYSERSGRLHINPLGLTMMACPPALMDQERKLVDALETVESYHIDSTGALVLSTRAGTTILARANTADAPITTYACENGSTVEASYPTTDTALVRYKSESIPMRIAISASGARYVGGSWQWWTKGMTEGTLSRLAPGETIASAAGMVCHARQSP